MAQIAGIGLTVAITLIAGSFGLGTYIGVIVWYW